MYSGLTRKTEVEERKDGVCLMLARQIWSTWYCIVSVNSLSSRFQIELDLLKVSTVWVIHVLVQYVPQDLTTTSRSPHLPLLQLVSARSSCTHPHPHT